MIQINKFEKQISAFHGYSFDNYSSLQLINYYLKSYINSGTRNQLLLDVSCEIEDEIESLQHIQFCTDKDAAFNDRVEYTLSIIKRLKKYFTKVEIVELNKTAIGWHRFKHNLGLQSI
ncbi:MAG: hypothetical protein JWQ84_2228 [Mucilaginibacter sp.]|nr:hypothetical protein [Mucilaginibacter sp.]MDB5017396.1 hypothetical protein [Mucilaginibacter sp.]